MFTTLIWGYGRVFYENFQLFKFYEKDQITIKCITGATSSFSNIMGYPLIAKERIVKDQYDLVIIASDTHYKEIVCEAEKIGFSEQEIISYRALKIPGLIISKYLELINNPPSIISINCWGGLTYHQLGMQFYSPTINMFFSQESYLEFAENIHSVIDEPIIFERMGYESNLKHDYPIGRYKDIELFFNHDVSFDQAIEKWERRKKRINWDNLFYMFLSDDKDEIERFERIPSNKKICFTHLECDEKSACTIQFDKDTSLAIQANKIAAGHYPYYDPVELLLTGERIICAY